MGKNRFSEEQIVGVLKEAEAAVPVAEFCRKPGITDVTFYRWNVKYGGLEVNEARRLREVRVLEALRASGRKPECIVCANGLEFTGQALDQWACANGTRLAFITLGKPIENAYVESFDGKLRNECLNENWFVALGDAREKIAARRMDCNSERPHSAVGYKSPEELAAEAATRLASPPASTGDLDRRGHLAPSATWISAAADSCGREVVPMWECLASHMVLRCSDRHID